MSQPKPTKRQMLRFLLDCDFYCANTSWLADRPDMLDCIREIVATCEDYDDEVPTPTQPSDDLMDVLYHDSLQHVIKTEDRRSLQILKETK